MVTDGVNRGSSNGISVYQRRMGILAKKQPIISICSIGSYLETAAKLKGLQTLYDGIFSEAFQASIFH